MDHCIYYMVDDLSLQMNIVLNPLIQTMSDNFRLLEDRNDVIRGRFRHFSKRKY